MKKHYFIIGLVFVLIGLILAFENITTSAAVLIFFASANQSLFFTLSLMMLLGMIAGFFLGLAYAAKSKKDDENISLNF